MRASLVLLILFLGLKSWSCGDFTPHHGYFYQIFDQTLISNTQLYAFLKADHVRTFYQKESNHPYDHPEISGNNALWQEVLKGWTLAEIELVLKGHSPEANEVWMKKGEHIPARVYIDFAKKCSRQLSYRNRSYSWDYNEILSKETPDPQLSTEAHANFIKESNPQLKLRYAYQLIRVFHYARQYSEAIAFYESKVKGKFEENEIYYYLLEQVAGCRYSLADYENAAFEFMKVFSKSQDRKEVGLLSYQWCNNHDADARTKLQSIEDSLDYFTILSLIPFSETRPYLYKLRQYAPDDSRLELLFMRQVNALEEEVLPTTLMDNEILPDLSTESRADLNELKKFASEVKTNARVKNKEYWTLCESYLEFLRGDIATAKALLGQVSSRRFKAQVERLNRVYKVFSWKKASEIDENWLALEIYKKQEALDPREIDVEWEALCLDYVAHLYYKSNHPALGYLIHNSIRHVQQLHSLDLIDELIYFVNKEGKTELEKALLAEANGAHKEGDAMDVLLFSKGEYYMMEGKPEIALGYFQKSKIKTHVYDMEWYEAPTKLLFSNNIMECFSCDEDEVMTDKIYRDKNFDFIAQSFNNEQLAGYLIKLEELRKSESDVSSKANYLLGNYYFNISNSGYYRGTVSGSSNCCDYYYFNYYEDSLIFPEDIIRAKRGFNLKDITLKERVYYDHASRALKYYNSFIASSENAELKARALYMMAKCELNQMYNNTKAEYELSNQEIRVPEEYKKSYYKLKKEYSSTLFYQEIQQRCGFFRNYAKSQ